MAESSAEMPSIFELLDVQEIVIPDRDKPAFEEYRHQLSGIDQPSIMYWSDTTKDPNLLFDGTMEDVICAPTPIRKIKAFCVRLSSEISDFNRLYELVTETGDINYPEILEIILETSQIGKLLFIIEYYFVLKSEVFNGRCLDYYRGYMAYKKMISALQVAEAFSHYELLNDFGLSDSIAESLNLFKIKHDYQKIREAINRAENVESLMMSLSLTSDQEPSISESDIRREIARVGQRHSDARFEDARQLARDLAADQWDEQKDLTITAVITEVQRIISADLTRLNLSKTPGTQTIRRWIDECVPKHLINKRGRPPKL